MNHTQQRLFDFIEQEFDRDDTIHFLALAAIEQQHVVQAHSTIFKVRVALTLQADSGISPYFDGTDIFVSISPTDIQLTHEDEWADGPPIREGSPIELALSWVTELAVPFFVSPEAQQAADHCNETLQPRNEANNLDNWV